MKPFDINLTDVKKCTGTYLLAINDTLNVLHGKWKLPIIGAMIQGHKRFSDIQRAIPKLTPRMLSKELRDLEANGIVKRHVYDTLPVLIEYELTPSAIWLGDVIDKMIEWGIRHRTAVLSDELV